MRRVPYGWFAKSDFDNGRDSFALACVTVLGNELSSGGVVVAVILLFYGGAECREIIFGKLGARTRNQSRSTAEGPPGR